MPRLRLPASPVENSLEGRAFVFSAFAVAVLAIALYGQDYVVPAVGLAATALGHIISYRGRMLKRTFTGQVVLASLIFGALAYFIADSVLAIFGGVLPQANFAIALVAVTSFDLKTRRNCYSSLWISLAILYLAAVYAWDYVFGVLVALWAAYLAGFWMATHLRRMEAKLSAPPAALATLVLGALAAGVVGFVLIPQPGASSPTPLVVSLPNFVSFKGQLENPALPLVQISGDPSGATGSIDLHFRGRLGDTPVMYVRTGAPAYWRGLVFDTYRDGSWTVANRNFVTFQPYIPTRLLPPAPPNNLGTFVQVFRVLRPLPGVINAAYPIQSLYAPVAALREDSYGTFHTPDVLKPGQTYSVVSYLPNLSAQELQKDTFAGGTTGVARAYLDTGGLSAQARSLAVQAVAGHTDNQFDTVMALTNYLQSNFQYSQQLGHVPAGRDPVDWFLFDAKIGYCEQFATAEALMLRSLGIPARLATGYSTGQYDSVLNQATVREQDAHAWVEVWFPNHGWVPVDPSPGFSALAATQFPDRWAAGGVAQLIPRLELGAPLAAISSLGILGVIPPAVAIALLFVIVWAWFRKRRWRGRVKAQPGESELLRLYERVQRRLGRRRAPPETPLEYRHQFRSALSPPPPRGGLGRGAVPLESLLEEVTAAVNEGAYAGRWPDPDAVREMANRLS
ncbi:MAG TPA: transglutaminaseTgpA domain-containing protein [Candidatus Dormibacteraeota bacterium]|nr:transglutaminaseTgpA domain-containing protein [Candidatus Dormibacteraeota bacterium]